MRPVLLFIALFAVADLQAASVFYSTKILRVSQSPGTNGGCLVRLEVGPATQGLADCNDRFVSFDCDGELGTSKSAANSMFNSALASMFIAAGNPSLLITDSQKFGSICVAKQIDVRP